MVCVTTETRFLPTKFGRESSPASAIMRSAREPEGLLVVSRLSLACTNSNSGWKRQKARKSEERSRTPWPPNCIPAFVDLHNFPPNLKSSVFDHTARTGTASLACVSGVQPPACACGPPTFKPQFGRIDRSYLEAESKAASYCYSRKMKLHRHHIRQLRLQQIDRCANDAAGTAESRG